MTKQYISWQRWSADGLLQYGQMSRKNVQSNLDIFRRKALEILQQTGADHVLYAVKHYNEDDELNLVKFYLEPMDDERYDRDVASASGVVVYAVHKR